jgi:thymidylate synthase (FAD)
VDAKDVRFIVPPFIRVAGENSRDCFEKACSAALESYEALQCWLDQESDRFGWSHHEKTKRINEAARSVLPNATETRMVWTANLRALRHIVALRGSEPADLEIRAFGVQLLDVMMHEAPLIFGDFTTHDRGDLPRVVTAEYDKV